MSSSAMILKGRQLQRMDGTMTSEPITREEAGEMILEIARALARASEARDWERLMASARQSEPRIRPEAVRRILANS